MSWSDNRGTFTEEIPLHRLELASDLLEWSAVLDTVKVTFEEFQQSREGGAQVTFTV